MLELDANPVKPDVRLGLCLLAPDVQHWDRQQILKYFAVEQRVFIDIGQMRRGVVIGLFILLLRGAHFLYPILKRLHHRFDQVRIRRDLNLNVFDIAS